MENGTGDFRVLLALVLGMILIFGSLSGPLLLSAFATHYVANPPSYFDVSPPYQYTTGWIARSNDDPIDVRAFNKWDTGAFPAPDYCINFADSNGPLSDDEIASFILAAEGTWYSAFSAESDMPRFDFVPTTCGKPSAFGPECSSGAETYNEINEIGFCGGAPPGEVRIHPSPRTTPGGTTTGDEADMRLDSIKEWDDDGSGGGDLQSVAAHEFGHWYMLGDLYELYSGNNPESSCWKFGEAVGENQNPGERPVMCGNYVRPVTVSDGNGIYQLYAEYNNEDLTMISTSNLMDGGDIAAAQIDGNSLFDLILVHTELDQTIDTSYIRAEFQWDLDPITGEIPQSRLWRCQK